MVIAALTALLVLCPAPASAGPCDALANNPEQASGISFGGDAVVSTVTGAILGAALGAVIGNNTGSGDARRGAVTGAVVGAGAGFLLGQVAAQRRQAFQSQSAYLDCEIEASTQLLAQRDAEVLAAQQQLEISQREVAEMQARIQADTATRNEIRALRNRLNAEVRGIDQQIANCQREMDYMQHVSELPPEGGDAQTLQVQRQQLAARRAELQTRFDELNRVKQETQMASNSLRNRRG
ncbi:MAG: glycine zipper 2TM domain-containing protein [Alphaproteobacteria bacterium]|nr:glycine zipper 2TM domain-containing protein [Alphaproteobacteria bacterium]